MRVLLKFIKKIFDENIHNIKNNLDKKIKYLEAYGKKKDFSILRIDDLAPKDDLEKCEDYCEVLEYGIENRKVFNIAITGPYGSGKSSILRTFENKYVKYKYINISLASFISNTVDLDDEINQDDVKINEQERSIEKGILQQLFYKVDSNCIPYARFRKIKNLKISSIIKNIILFVTTLGLTIIIFKPNLIDKFLIRVNELYSFSNIYITALIYISFIILIIYDINLIIRELKVRVNLSTLKFKNTEIEFESNGSESILNKYLDEILYFFEVTKYNVVVIEDLDRFNSTNIFTKLRELNQLINNYEKIKRKVVFIYAIKDDIFKNNERSKFFELIVPIIPVINSINSGNILLEKIRQDSLGNDISNEFIIGVSVYIEDMRMLTNIYNEYRIYRKRLDDDFLKSENILALVIYKNLYPGDFSELLYNKGLLYSAFENKKNIIKEIEIDIDEEISNLNLKVESIKNEHLININELKSLFLSYISNNKLQITTIEGNTIDSFMEDSFDIYNIITRDIIRYKYYRNGNGQYEENINVKNINNSFNGDISLKERFDYLKYKNEDKQNELLDKINLLKEEKKKLQSLKLHELIKNYGINKVLKEEVIKEKVIVYLLRNNKINETYINYLTYFHNNIVTAQDMSYILGVRNYEAQRFDYKLNKIDNIIDKLNKIEFEQKEILNFSLFRHVLNNRNKYQEYFQIIIKQLSDESELSIDFIDQIRCLLNEDEESVFWESICKSWSNLWIVIKNNCNYSIDKLNAYVCKIIKYVDIAIIKELNIDNEVVNYIENHKELLELFSEIHVDKIKEVINELNIKFNYIDGVQVRKELFKFIIEEKYYEINTVNIECILTIIHNKNINDIRQKNFTTIRDSEDISLNEYIDENILKYISKVFLNIEENTEEDINRIIELLNLDNETVDESIKIYIINKESFKLEDIDEVDKVIWEELLKQEKIKVSWNNISSYYNNIKELDSSLINYLNSKEVYQKLSENKIEKNDINLYLIEAILSSEKFERESINYIAECISWTYEEYDTSKINISYIDILIEKGIIELTKNIYDSLRENYCDLHIKLIEFNLQKYFENIDDFDINYEEMYKILSFKNCESIDKERMILKIKNKLNNSNNIIIDNDELIEEIFKVIVVEKHEINLESRLYWNIFDEIINEKKIKLLSCQCKYLTKEQIDESLKRIGIRFGKITRPASREKIEYSDDVIELANNLETCEYISSKSIVHWKNKKYVQFNAKRK